MNTDEHRSPALPRFERLRSCTGPSVRIDSLISSRPSPHGAPRGCPVLTLCDPDGSARPHWQSTAQYIPGTPAQRAPPRSGGGFSHFTFTRVPSPEPRVPPYAFRLFAGGPTAYCLSHGESAWRERSCGPRRRRRRFARHARGGRRTPAGCRRSSRVRRVPVGHDRSLAAWCWPR